MCRSGKLSNTGMRIVQHIFFYKFDIDNFWGMRKEKALPILCSSRTNVDPLPTLHCSAYYKPSWYFFWFPLFTFPLLTAGSHPHILLVDNMSFVTFPPAAFVWAGKSTGTLTPPGVAVGTEKAGFGHSCVLQPPSNNNEWI